MTLNKFILIASLFACACTPTRPVDSVPPITITIIAKVECVNDKADCLKQSAEVCANYSFNGFIINSETSGTISIDGGMPERGWQLTMQCLNCIDTKRTCYTTYR